MTLWKNGNFVEKKGTENLTKNVRSYLNSPKQNKIFFSIYRYFNGNIDINFEISKNIDILIEKIDIVSSSKLLISPITTAQR